jgi:hypothetical protein
MTNSAQGETAMSQNKVLEEIESLQELVFREPENLGAPSISACGRAPRWQPGDWSLHLQDDSATFL